MGELILDPNSTAVNREPMPVKGWNATDITAVFNPFVAEASQNVVTGTEEIQPVTTEEDSIPHVPITEEASIFQQLLNEYVLERKAPIEAMSTDGTSSADQFAAWKNANETDVPYANRSLGDLINDTMANVDRQLAEMKSIIALPSVAETNDQFVETVLIPAETSVEPVEYIAPVISLDEIRIQKFEEPSDKPMFRDEVTQTQELSKIVDKKVNRRAKLLGSAAAVLAMTGTAFGAAFLNGYQPDEAYSDARASVSATSSRVERMDTLNLATFEKDDNGQDRKSKVSKFIGKYLVGIAR